MFSANLMQAVLNYLKTKPYDEVAGLIGAIMQENEANQKAAQPKPVSDDADDADDAA